MDLGWGEYWLRWWCWCWWQQWWWSWVWFDLHLHLHLHYHKIVHFIILLEWSNISACSGELCYKWSVYFGLQWFCSPQLPSDKRNMYGDMACFVLLTPLAACSAWLCLSGAQHYAQFEATKWETVGLISLSVFLLLIYQVWCAVSRYASHISYHSSI